MTIEQIIAGELSVRPQQAAATLELLTAVILSLLSPATARK